MFITLVGGLGSIILGAVILGTALALVHLMSSHRRLEPQTPRTTTESPASKSPGLCHDSELPPAAEADDEADESDGG
jgi:hypothetical protein